MTSPSPPVPFSGSLCSVISNNVLYTYSAAAFQSLPLVVNGTWSQLQNGVAVNNAACTLQPASGAGTNDVLWVVGGTASDPTYTGLQSYTFATQTWQTITPSVQVTQNRMNHAVVYLPGIPAILMYAGSQSDPSTPSVETYTIGVEAPYAVLAGTGQNTPVVSPLLLPWDDYSAITLGGAADNTNIFIWGLTGWQGLQPSLAFPLKTSDVEQATLVQGSDGSRVVELYDMSLSPNNITQIVLEDASGQPAGIGLEVGTVTRRSVHIARDLELDTWPPINSSLAPSATRSGFSLARSTDGVVAIVGGAGPNHSVALFNDQQNTWLSTTDFFGGSANQQPIVASSSTSSSASSTATASRTASASPTLSSASSPTSSSAPFVNLDHPQTSLILGITLGTVLGIVALLVLILLILRCRRRRKEQNQWAGREDDDDDEKDRMSFEDRGDPFMKETMGPTYPASHTTMSIYEGQTNQADNPRTHRRSETRGSEKSTTYLVPKTKDMYEMNTIRDRTPNMPSPIQEGSRAGSSLQVPNSAQGGRRTSGWGRYFSSTDAGARTSASTTHGKAGSTGRSSTSSNHDHGSHGPTLPPLDMGQGFHEVRINRAVTGNGGEHVPQYTRTSEERPRTVSSTFSTVPPSTSASLWSHEANEEPSTWTPVTQWTSTNKPRDTTRDTTASSFYGESINGSEYDRNSRASANFPGLHRMPSGAHVLPQTVHEEDDHPINKPFRKAGSVSKSAHPPLPNAPLPNGGQVSDLSWVNLGKK